MSFYASDVRRSTSNFTVPTSETFTESAPSCGCSCSSPANMIRLPSAAPARAIVTRVAAHARGNAPVSGSTELRREDRDRVHAAAARIARERLVTLANRHRDDVGRDARKDQDRRAQRALRRGDVDQIALCQLQPLGGLRIQLDPAAPHRRRQRVGHLLEPRQMRRRSVTEGLRRVGQKVERVLRRIAVKTPARRTSSPIGDCRLATAAATCRGSSAPSPPPRQSSRAT